MTDIALELDHATRRFGHIVAVNDVSLTVRRGEFLTLLGPSGSGKTSTLRVIGGFEKLDAGEVRINGARVDHLPAYQRDTATIFQSGALFPHKTVAENVLFGLRMRGVQRSEAEDRVRKAIDMVQLGGLEDRYPAQLSGGQKQRVALARSMAVRPAILLFDEPLSALDLSLRLQLRAEIKRLHDELGFTAIYVTHDQGEAMAMSSRVAVMRQGRIEQVDRPEVVYQNPANEFVYTFIGESCCGTVTAKAGVYLDRSGQPLSLQLAQKLPDGVHRIYTRPSRLKLQLGNTRFDNTVTGPLVITEFLGDFYRYHVKPGDIESFFVDHPHNINVKTGDNLTVGWDSVDMRIFT